MCEITRETIAEYRRRFNSGNSTPVERVHFKRDEGLALLDAADELERLREGLRQEIEIYKYIDPKRVSSTKTCPWIVVRLEVLLNGADQ